jgi:putative transposase
VFEFVRAHQGQYAIAGMCRVLGVSTSGYYGWRQRPPSRRQAENAALSQRIRAIHAQSRQTYGARRVHAELQAQGEAVSRPRVARLMRALGLSGVTRRKRRNTTRRDPQAALAPDRVKRQFRAAEANRLWVADITYVPTQEGFVFLAMVLDVFSRKIVGWAMGARQTVELVQAALEMALATRAVRQVVFHSDRGSQYTALAFTRRCAEAGVERSMGAAGNCYDNAMAESFFATLECELLQRVPFASREQAEQELFVFVEAFYNRQRRHSALGYLSPVEFERAWYRQQQAA